jgi:hydrogenase nickel incorporation protein HypB
MCDTCGCSDPNQEVTIKKAGAKIENSGNQQHSHGHGHSHGHHNEPEKVNLSQNILSENDLLAARNRGFFEGRRILALNIVSSPGSGKTTLLEQCIKQLKGSKDMFVIEGDQQTSNDADRIVNAGAEAVQINTGNGCHLDAHMIHHAMDKIQLSEGSILFIENVGNLVCPALFDLGESERIVVISVTEGADKPLKYPNMFNTSQVCVINKMDLLPYVDFNLDYFKECARKINPEIVFIETSASKSDGIDKWLKYLESRALT